MAPLPLAELHLHLEGTFEPELVFELARRNNIELPYADEAALRAKYSFTDLPSFLELYYQNMMVLQTKEDFADLTRAYLARAAEGGIRHAEIMFDPQAHTSRGVALATCVEGIAEVLATSERDYGISTLLFAAFLRDRPAEEAGPLLEELLAMSAPIIGVGLDSAEVGYPPEPFAPVFQQAGAAGLRRIAHAGEEGPASYVWQALDLLGAERIDHGIRSVDDEELVARLVAEQMPLTVCPLSNVRLRAVDTLADHPLPEMLRRGLNVSINSDDPSYFGGYAEENMAAVADTFGFDAEQQAELAANAVRASFADSERKTELLTAIDEWARAHSATQS